MRGRELADASRAKAGPTTSQLNRRKEEIEPADALHQQSGLLARGSARAAPGMLANTHASILARAMTSRSPSIHQNSLLQLQRQYGNRHVQRVVSISSESEGDSEVGPEVEQAVRSRRGNGQSLDRRIRSTMGPTFGADFSQVRVHTDAQADALNRTLSARAFTTGRDIFFRQGEYNPGNSNGQKLIAHELTHVVQQGGSGIRAKLTVSQPGDPYERQADQVAKEVVQQQRIARQPLEEEDEMMQMKSLPGVAANIFR